VKHGLGDIEVGWRQWVGGFARERGGGGDGGVDTLVTTGSGVGIVVKVRGWIGDGG
jgi:hypothetical protein